MASKEQENEGIQARLEEANSSNSTRNDGEKLGVHPKHITVELISLKTHGIKDVPGWLQLFDDVAKINSWDQQVQGIILLNQIAEAGLQDQLGIQFSNAKNVHLLKELLTKTFTQKRSQIQLIAEIKEGQHRRESLKQFANRMSTLCEKVHTTEDNTAMDKFKMEAFIEGIAERKIFDELKREEPRSLEQAIKIAEKWDEIHENRQACIQDPIMMVMKKPEKQVNSPQSQFEKTVMESINQMSIKHKEEMEQMRNLIAENNRSQRHGQNYYGRDQRWRRDDRRGPGRDERMTNYLCWNYRRNRNGNKGYKIQRERPRRINIIQAHGMIQLKLNNKPVEVLLDSGSSVNVMSNKIWKEISQNENYESTKPEEFNTASNSPLMMDKIAMIEIEIGNIKEKILFWITSNNDMPTLIGSKTLSDLKLNLNMGKGCVVDEHRTWAIEGNPSNPTWHHCHCVKMADKEESEPTIAQDLVVTKYKMLAEMVNRVLNKLIEKCDPEESVISICETGDKLILEETGKVFKKEKEMKKRIAFPTWVSVNNCICHFSPLKSEPDYILKEGDMAKLDLGAHIDGFIAAVAHTLIVGASKYSNVTGRKADVIKAAYYAAEAVLRLVKPGNENSAGTDAIQKIAEVYKCKPVEGMLSHQLKQFRIDGEKSIIQNPSEAQRKEHEKCELELHEVYTIDVLVSSSEGKGREMDTRTTVYKKTDEIYQLKMKASRAFFSEVDKRFNNMPFTLRAFEDEKKARMGVVECVNHKLLEPFTVLYENEGEYVAQFKFTVLLMASGSHKITSGPIDLDLYESEHSLEHESLKVLLHKSVGPKSAKTKKKKAEKAIAGSVEGDATITDRKADESSLMNTED